MKITTTQHDCTVTIERPEEDLNLDDMLELFETLLRALGYAVPYGSVAVLKDDDTVFASSLWSVEESGTARRLEILRKEECRG